MYTRSSCDLLWRLILNYYHSWLDVMTITMGGRSTTSGWLSMMLPAVKLWCCRLTYCVLSLPAGWGALREGRAEARA